MIENNKNGLNYFSFSNFPQEITNAMFSRVGGVSIGGPCGLNVGSTVGDDLANVQENKRKIFETLDLPMNTFYDCWQVHGNDHILVNSSHHEQGKLREIKADAMLTNDPNVTLFMRFADCTPILIHDPVKNVVGVAHAGWQGTVKRVASNLVKAFQNIYRSDPRDLIAGIGPSIGPDHYVVGENVVEQVKIAYSHRSIGLIHKIETKKVTFDLWEANRIDLQQAGVKNIEVANICTACDTERWFSHRAERGRTGRFAAVISLSKGGIQ